MTELIVPEFTGTEFDDWLATGQQLKIFRRQSKVLACFAVGWWVIDGQARFGEDYAQGLDLWTDEDFDGLPAEKTLYNYVWLARRFDKSLVLGYPSLSLKHYKVVAALDEDSRLQWLEHCATTGMSANALERELRLIDSGSPNGANGSDHQFAADVDLDRWRSEAALWKTRYLLLLSKVHNAARLLKDSGSVTDALAELQAPADESVQALNELLSYWRAGNVAATTELLDAMVSDA